MNKNIKTKFAQEVCFWCGQPKNNIVQVEYDTRMEPEPQDKVITDYEPCDDCIKNFTRGITLLEVTDMPQCGNQPTIDGKYPTGNFAVVTENGIRNFIKEPQASEIIEAKKALIDQRAFKELFKNVPDTFPNRRHHYEEN